MLMTYSEIVNFHGHECPGLAIGYRMAEIAMEKLNLLRAADEEIVAIVENDSCGVDALQCLTGCTFGKGNLIFHDYGKHVYTLYSRNSGKGVRVVFHGKGIPKDLRNNKTKFKDWLLNAYSEDLFSTTPVRVNEPAFAKIHKSIPCDICGESVMQTKIKNINSEQLCIPCSENISLDRSM